MCMCARNIVNNLIINQFIVVSVFYRRCLLFLLFLYRFFFIKRRRKFNSPKKVTFYQKFFILFGTLPKLRPSESEKPIVFWTHAVSGFRKMTLMRKLKIHTCINSSHLSHVINKFIIILEMKQYTSSMYFSKPIESHTARVRRD